MDNSHILQNSKVPAPLGGPAKYVALNIKGYPDMRILVNLATNSILVGMHPTKEIISSKNNDLSGSGDFLRTIDNQSVFVASLGYPETARLKLTGLFLLNYGLSQNEIISTAHELYSEHQSNAIKKQKFIDAKMD